MKRLNRLYQQWTAAFDRWLREEYHLKASQLAFFRILFALYILLVASPYYHATTLDICTYPDALFYPPPGPMALLSGFPPCSFIVGTRLLIDASALALLLGFRACAASLTLGAALLLHDGVYFSVGKIDHGRVLLFTVPLVLAFSGWGNRLSVASAGNDREVPSAVGPALAVLALFVGFSLFSAGVPKVLGGWLDPERTASLSHLLVNIHVNERTGLLALPASSLPSPAIWIVADWVIVFFEIGFLFAIASRRVFMAFCCAAVAFHTGVLLIFNISFVHQLVVYGAFVAWPTPREGFAGPRSRSIIILTLLVLFALRLLVLPGAQNVRCDGIPMVEFILFASASLVTVLLVLRAFRACFSTTTSLPTRKPYPLPDGSHEQRSGGVDQPSQPPSEP